MITINRNQAALSTSHRGGNNKNADNPQSTKNADYPQSTCGAPSTEFTGATCDVDVCSAMVATMTMAEGNRVPTKASESSSKENVRPNSGNSKKKWRKKINQNHRHVAPGGDEASPTTATAEDDSRAKNSAEENRDKNGKEILLKTQKAVVVEISSQNPPHRPILPPNIDYNVAANGSSPASSNEESASSRGFGRVKKSRPKKNKKNSNRHKSKAKKGGSPANYTIPDFSTNAEGASVLAMLGQYPYAMPAASQEGSYHGGPPSPLNPQMMMDGIYDAYQDQYDPSNFSSNASNAVPPQIYAGNTYQAYGVQYPCPSMPIATPDMNPGAAAAMPVGYYVPVMMTQHNGVVYYNQQQSATAAVCSAYYPTYYSDGPEPAPAQPHNEGGSSGKSLNIDAPAFNPEEKTKL